LKSRNTNKLYEAAKDSAARFNECWPIGTCVKYYPALATNSDYVESKTRSEAWAISSGSVIILIEGKSGGVSLGHIEVLPGQPTNPLPRP
jgi:hypothetical protein